MANAPRSTTKKSTTASSEPAGNKRALVIVESPAKAKTINKYLGSQYIVKSSVGHVRDLPTGGSAKSGEKKPATRAKLTAEEKEQKAQNALINRMGVDPEHDWKAHYEVLPGKEHVVAELKKLASQVDEVYLATDLDREGEAIAWHLKEVIGGDDSRYQRVVFNEITKNAIQEAFKHPARLDTNKVNAQQARRFLDRVVGFMISPLLWEKIARGLSAGRVQSVAVKLVVERERDIRAFIPEEYWQIFADTLSKKDQIRLEAVKQAGKTLKLRNKADTDAVLNLLKDAEYKVAQREDKPTKVNPSAPYITSTLQQAASTRLGFSVKKTMMLAQRLYEGGFITYMRTDSTFLSDDAVNMVRDHIQQQFGDKYVPAKPNRYGNKAGAQEAHEAIRPSNVALTGDQLAGMERDAQRLYDLIWRQFVACQMTPAEYLSSTLIVDANNVELRAKGRTLVFDGFTRVRGANKSDDDVLLPAVKVGETLKLEKLDPSQHFTKPPARFTEASLVKELEKRGIGRPSTYAAIISTIQDRGYVKLENRRLFAEKMGEIVTDRLDESFNNLMNYAFTADLEGQLDKVATGERNWKELLDSFYGDFKNRLNMAASTEGMRRNQPVEVPDVACQLCSRPMQIRTGTTGVFLGCSGYNLPPKERCKGTLNLTPVESLAAFSDDDSAETADLMAKHRCAKCGTAMDSYVIDGGRKLHVCGNNPDCDGYEVEEGEFKIKGYDGPTIPCDKCDGEMQLKTGRFGPYFACTSCDNTRKVLKSGQPAPPRVDPIKMEHLRSVKHDDYFVLRDGAAGLFLAASKFPKIRETRAPKVAELRTVAEQLDPKYQYLLQAPDADPEGNPALIKFSRKNQAQYVGSETPEGKQTKWSLVYQDGKWTEA
ncbi:type I DNA topoisomerase [Acinetobacter baylyi]|uniref:DNA topoisomerase 1 n=1 Tax=Acinetobacter baylyi (strain ATCC 33305 / BD413 / ADP1) TaxID=62977 RepID=Q6FET8_ACIAD|nr:type I DNA topoisomerase [Acinetobacter baylyi]ENV52716.1 DNA topoisomerase I [Acinetobacter baylyi DSM 14961 = CIP 107474]KAF2369977.1 DNA topoisomerase I [Acinetobacter baylyi]KAF2375832.1 DNA topoisomerase I [Acinetobacter baylyi]KAF2377391.1 DNA topoisomerase I [Acinetobacter baylyi]KAF2383305.1 DNA topoisomerase I [Acinetobacter baylyi]